MGFGLIFIWAFDIGGAVSEPFRFRGTLATAEGEVVAWTATNLTINDMRVFETSYSFRSADGSSFTGASYQTGSYRDSGERVTVEYVPTDPTVSRIQGMRASSSGIFVVFVVIFPLVGLVLALVGMRKGLRARRLMSTGRLALGTLQHKEPTSTRVNNRVVYRYTFAFEAEGGGEYETVAKTHRYDRLEDEEKERIVYDPRNPSDATVLDELPCRANIDSRGDFVAGGPADSLVAALNLVLPGLTVVAYSAYLLL
jgi:hypothetical protein